MEFSESIHTGQNSWHVTLNAAGRMSRISSLRAANTESPHL